MLILCIDGALRKSLFVCVDYY